MHMTFENRLYHSTHSKESGKARVTQGLHDASCLTDSFVFTPGHCVSFQAMRYE